MDIESRKQLFNDVASKVKLYKIAVDEMPKIERIDDISVSDISISKNGVLSLLNGMIAHMAQTRNVRPLAKSGITLLVT